MSFGLTNASCWYTLKIHVKSLYCVGILDSKASLIVETDISDIGYGVILK